MSQGKISPVFLPLWSGAAVDNLQIFLNDQRNLTLDKQIQMEPETLRWTVSPEPTTSPYAIKLLDAVDLSKAFVAYGALSGDDALSARSIVQKMQSKVLGLEKTEPNLNNLADLLLNVLPPEAVAMLLIEKKGMALIEMPFISPFPLHTSESDEPQTTPARVGLLIQGNKDIVSTVWKPDLHGDNEPAKTVWTRKDLSLAEYRLIHRIESSQPHALFTAPSLAGAIMENGKQDKQQSLVFGYVHKQFPGVVSSNYHERKMNIAAVHQVMNFAIVAHKTFQHEHAMNLLKENFGSCSELVASPGVAARNRDKKYENPWGTKEAAAEALKMLPEVAEDVRQGVYPVFALEKLAQSTEHAQSMANSFDPEEAKACIGYEVSALLETSLKPFIEKSFKKYPFESKLSQQRKRGGEGLTDFQR